MAGLSSLGRPTGGRSAVQELKIRMTLSWRGMDSNFQYAGAVNLIVAPLGRPRRLIATPTIRGPRQPRVVQAIYDGASNPRTHQQIWPGFLRGSETFWREVLVGNPNAPGAARLPFSRTVSSTVSRTSTT